MVEQYECPNCGVMDTMLSVFSGRKKFYKCEICGAEYTRNELVTIWSMGRSKKMLKPYECPNCGIMNTMRPVFSGRKRYFKCEVCGAEYTRNELIAVWGISKKKKR